MNKQITLTCLQKVTQSFFALLFITFFIGLSPNEATAQNLPAGFADTEYVGGFNQAVGVTFDANGRMYVWEKRGIIWVVENGVRLPNPLLDISEEVGNWRDFGMLGVALDPNFLSNGKIYCLYIVDRHHLLNFGTGSYNSNTNEYFDATIGRITRYTATQSSNFTQVDYTTRNVLFGETADDGFPNLHQSHGTGHLVFGTDGTLLASLGDGASYSSVDQGSASETYWQQAITDGIITSAENIGAYRSQLLDNYAGKILRIDPETGAGIPSNPYYQAANPSSRRSKVWARGVRNPCRFSKKPGTGSHNPADGNPGVFYVGDVGWGGREELDVVDAPGLNFGWPKWEGMTNQPGYNNNTYTPSTHERPKVDWRNGTARGLQNGNIVNVGSAALPGPSTTGNCSIGGIWYEGDDFPAEYKNTYFHADYGGDWIKNMSFNANDDCIEVKNFKSAADRIVFVATDPFSGGIYYLAGAAGNSNNITNAVRQISFTGGNLPPVAVASADVLSGPSPLTVNFQGSQSYDPNDDDLTYSWNFGNGATSNEANPQYTYTSGNSNPQGFDVTLTVSDGSLSSTSSLQVSLNNTAPVINSTSVDNINTFSYVNGRTLNLSANVSDAEHNNSSLQYQWIVELHHNDHFHQEPPITSQTASTVLSPIGCDGATYWYRVILTVTDPAGLFTTYQKDIFPNCPGTNQTISFNNVPDKLITAGPFNLTASASSGLPVIFHVVSGPATVSGNTITLSGEPGEVLIRAIQSGNATYKPAQPKEQSFLVLREKFDQTITFPTLSNKLTTAAPFNISATASSGLAVNFIIVSGPATISGNTITLTGNEGTVTVRARQGGNNVYNAAPNVNRTFTVTAPALQNQTINFPALADKLTTDAPFNISATATSGLAVSFSIVSGPATMSGNTITLTGNEGTVTVRASQAGNGQYNPAPNVNRSFSVTEPTTGECQVVSNLAFNKSATQSSVVFGAAAARAVDGNTNGDFLLGSVVATDNELNAWWEVDLGDVYRIEAIKVWNRTDNRQDRLSDYYVFVSDVPFSSTNLNTTLNQSGVTDFYQSAQASTPTSITAGRTGRYVRVQLNYAEHLTIAEIEVMGCSSGTDNTRPTVSLSTPSNNVSGAFPVQTTFSEPIAGLTLNDFTVTNGTASGLSGSGASYSFNVTPTADGTVTVRLPANRTTDAAGNQNTASNTVSVIYEEGTGGGDCTSTSNLAVGGTATQSSVVFGAAAAKANDGNVDGNFLNGSVSATDNEQNAWWQLDLGDVYQIEEINIFNRTDNRSDRLSNYYVLVSDVPFSSTNLSNTISQSGVSNYYESPQAGSPTVVTAGRTGRYVRVQLNYGEHLTIAEVEVIGCSTGVDETRPTVSLSTASNTVNGPFVVNANFSESVTGVALNDFTVTNGSKSGLSGSGATYSFTVSPTADGAVTVRMPANRAADGAGNQNTASNTLSITYDSSVTCDNVTNGGSIVGNETNCGPFDPALITNGSSSSGGSGARQYKWQTSFASASGPWIDITGANNATYNPGNSTVTAWYRRLARRAGCSDYVGISNSVMKEVDPNCGGSGYCSSKGDFPWHEWIAGVEIGSFNNPSGKNQYTDFTSSNINLTSGNNYAVELTTGYSWTTYNEYFRIWIDLNGDEDFEDSGEQVFQKQLTAPATGTPSASITGSFTLPATAANGQTRMRVSMTRGAYPDPCGTNEFGEVEDYTVTISGSAAANRALLYFSAQKQNQAVELSWTTNTEYKNDYFNIQRSTDGFNYQTIAEMDSEFDSQTGAMDYYFMDEEPLNGETFYRIQQVYHDGGFHFTKVQKVKFVADLDAVSIFPNPTTGEVFINLRKYADEAAVLVISDQLGREIERTKLGRVPNSAMLFDLSRYNNGIYFITVKVEGKRKFTQKVVLNRLD